MTVIKLQLTPKNIVLINPTRVKAMRIQDRYVHIEYTDGLTTQYLMGEGEKPVIVEVSQFTEDLLFSADVKDASRWNNE